MRRRTNSYAGFTIAELLVAAAITSAIVILLGTMFGSLTNTSTRANQRIDAFRDARAGLQMIARDLSALVRNQRDATGAPITRPAAYFALTNIYTDPQPGNQQLYFLAALKNSAPGDVCAVGYYCRWDTQRKAYSLYRYFRDSADTFTAIRNAPTYVPAADLYQPDPPATAPASARDEVLASYVWNMQVRPFDSAGAAITTTGNDIWDSSAAVPSVLLPAFLEISFHAMSTNAARALIATGADSAAWIDETTGTYQRLIRPHVYDFRTRVKL